MTKKLFRTSCLRRLFAAAVLRAQQPAAPPCNPQTVQPAPAPAAAAAAQPGRSRQPAQQVGRERAHHHRLGVNEVNLIFTVTDKHGHYIPNLQQSDFALLDDQRRRRG